MGDVVVGDSGHSRGKDGGCQEDATAGGKIERGLLQREKCVPDETSGLH